MEAGQLFCGGCYGESYGATCGGCGSIGGDQLWVEALVSSGTLTASLAL